MWRDGRWSVAGDPSVGASIPELARAARGALELPAGVETGLDAEAVYDPPNLTFPFGAYVCVVDVDPGTAVVKVRRFIAVDDCGVRINPMIVEGQIHGGLTDGVGIALMETIAFDEDGNCLAGSLMDYLIPTAVEVPDWETDFTVTPSPHHPLGAKGVGESATVGSPPAIVNAICDALGVAAHRHAVHTVPGLGGHAVIPAHRIEALVAAREPFVVATVVRAAKPTSVRPGDSALVLADGTIEGFVGGVCAQESVRLYAARALETGEATLLRLLPGPRDDRARPARRRRSSPTTPA